MKTCPTAISHHANLFLSSSSSLLFLLPNSSQALQLFPSLVINLEKKSSGFQTLALTQSPRGLVKTQISGV